MADVVRPRGRSVLADLSLPAKEGTVVVSGAGFASRYIYRGAPEHFPAAFGITLPTTPMRAEARDGRAALWLGPDEWLLLAPVAEEEALRSSLGDGLRGLPASLVDVGHRQIGIVIAGLCAADLLNAGCPLDLDRRAFPVGMCTRTILAKAEIVLWRTADDAFRLEIARSVVPYVVEFLREAMFGID